MATIRGLANPSRSALLPRRYAIAGLRTSQPRLLHSSALRQFPYKDDQDRESLKPRAQDSSKSGSDEDAAHSDAAFNPNKTSPEEAKNTSKQESNGDSLEVSGANPDISKSKGATKEVDSDSNSG